MESRTGQAWRNSLSAPVEATEHSEVDKGGKGLVISAGSTGVNPKHSAQMLLVLSSEALR